MLMRCRFMEYNKKSAITSSPIEWSGKVPNTISNQENKVILKCLTQNQIKKRQSTGSQPTDLKQEKQIEA